MAPPGSVGDSDDFVHWIAQQIEWSGAQLVPKSLDAVFLFDAIEVDRVSGLFVPRHRLVFGNDLFIEFTVTVDENLTQVDYVYHLVDSRLGLALVGYRRHDGHEHDDGGRTHRHVYNREIYEFDETHTYTSGSQVETANAGQFEHIELREPWPEVFLDDVIQLALDVPEWPS